MSSRDPLDMPSIPEDWVDNLFSLGWEVTPDSVGGSGQVGLTDPNGKLHTIDRTATTRGGSRVLGTRDPNLPDIWDNRFDMMNDLERQARQNIRPPSFGLDEFREATPGKAVDVSLQREGVFQERQDARSLFRSLLETISNAQSGGQRQNYQRTVGSDLPLVSFWETPTGAGERDGRSAMSNNREGPLAWGGYANGKIPLDAMTGVSDYHRLAPHAATGFEEMLRAAQASDINLSLASSYRSFDDQVRIRAEKGGKVATATPGTSRHGWGLAIDVSGAAGQKWMRENGPSYGWQWPTWAQERGTKNYEPWHFEYVGKAPAPAVQPVVEETEQSTQRQVRNLEIQ